MKYFSLVGSYTGGIKFSGMWFHVKELNRIDKTGWERHQGPLTRAQVRCLKQTPFESTEFMKMIAKSRTY